MTVTKTKKNLDSFLLNNLLDREYNGFFTAIDGENDIICDDKQLEDQALAIISLCHVSKDNDGIKSEITYLLEIFEHLKDEESIGCIELTDRFWQPHGPGWVRTSAVQLCAALALLEAGDILKNNETINKGLNLLDQSIKYYVQAGFPKRLDRNWQEILDYRKDLKSISFLLLALEKAYKLTENDSYLSNLKLAAEELLKFRDKQYGGAFSLLANTDQPWKSEGKKAEDMGLAVLAIYKIQYLLDDSLEINSFAVEIVDFILDNMKQTTLEGFWNKANIDGSIKVEAVQAYYNKEVSPFPVKLMADQGLILLAISLVKNNSDKSYDEHLQSLSNEMIKFIDHTNGGVFLGQGNFFSTPLDPTAPLIRQLMVPPHTPGAFHAGNTAYVPLHQKQVKTQAITLLSISLAEELGIDIFSIGKEFRPEPVSLEPSPIKQNLDYIAKEVNHLELDIPKYLKWSRSTKAGPAYGLTAYRSPLGFRSDRSNQNFSAMHVLSDLRVLNIDVEEPDLLIDSMISSQNNDGGFGEQPSHPSEVFTTYCVIISAFILDKPLKNQEKIISYLQSCQNSDGGFGNAPGFPSDVWHTNLGVLALHVLGQDPLHKDECIAYIAACQKEDGSYTVQPGSVADTFSTFRAVSSLVALGKLPPNHEKTIEWLKNCQTNEGGFLYKPGISDTMSFVGSYCALAALYMLGELPNDVESCKKWIANHQGPDGGFSRVEGTPSDTTDEGFISIQASYMLENALNPYWAAIIT